MWTVPSRRMKAGRVHRVPLSTAAKALLRAVRPDQPAGTDLVFASVRSRTALSDMSMTVVLRRMNEVPEGQPAPWGDATTGEPITVHGFRSTFRVWAGEACHLPARGGRGGAGPHAARQGRGSLPALGPAGTTPSPDGGLGHVLRPPLPCGYGAVYLTTFFSTLQEKGIGVIGVIGSTSNEYRGLRTTRRPPMPPMTPYASGAFWASAGHEKNLWNAGERLGTLGNYRTQKR